MASPLTVKRNEYRKNPKRSDIPTPHWLCEQVAGLFPATPPAEMGGCWLHLRGAGVKPSDMM
jgi:hypothetical protein